MRVWDEGFGGIRDLSWEIAEQRGSHCHTTCRQLLPLHQGLMSQLGTANVEEKEIVAKLRKLGEDMKAPAPGPAPSAEAELQSKLVKPREEVLLFLLTVPDPQVAGPGISKAGQWYGLHEGTPGPGVMRQRQSGPLPCSWRTSEGQYGAG